MHNSLVIHSCTKRLSVPHIIKISFTFVYLLCFYKEFKNGIVVVDGVGGIAIKN